MIELRIAYRKSSPRHRPSGKDYDRENGSGKRHLSLLARWLAALAGVLIFPAAALAGTVAITADRMLDVVTGRYVERPLVIVTDGRISAIGTQGTTNVPQGAEVVALPGRTLLPGLIDMHVHLDSLPQYGGYRVYEFSDQFSTVAAVKQAGDMLRAGFTTVRNLGSENYADVALKQAIDEGLAEGPRIVPAAYPIGATGGHADQTFFPPSFARKSPAVGDGPEELRRRVREQRKYGAEIIKVMATGGVFSRNTEPGQQQLSEAELRAVAEEAHQWGLRTAAHAHGAAGIKAAIRAGIDTIEHASLVDDEGIRLAAQRVPPVWFSMDIFNSEYTQAEGKKNGVLEDNLRKDREVTAIQRDNFRKAHRAGVRMIFGSDAGVMPHGTAAGQFRWMVQYGMTPIEAIRAATLNAAEALGDRGNGVGRIAVGRYGDLIAVTGDPLTDVRVLERVDTVIKGGEVVRSR